jgi:hypothetical protein
VFKKIEHKIDELDDDSLKFLREGGVYFRVGGEMKGIGQEKRLNNHILTDQTSLTSARTITSERS